MTGLSLSPPGTQEARSLIMSLRVAFHVTGVPLELSQNVVVRVTGKERLPSAEHADGQL